MARKFSAFTNNPSRVPLDTLVGLDISAAAAAQNSYWSLNTLFSEITGNITDGAVRFGGFAAPAVSAAGKAAIYFDSSSNTLKLSQNTGAYADVRSGTVTVPEGGTGLTTLTAYALMAGGTTATGNMQQVSGVGTSGQVLTSNGAGALPTWQTAAGTIGGSIANTQVAVGSGVNTIAGSSALAFSASPTAILQLTGAVNNTAGLSVIQNTSGTAAEAGTYYTTTTSASYLVHTSALFTTANLKKANQLSLYAGVGTVEVLFQAQDASVPFIFGNNNAAIASINGTATEGLVLGIASSLTGRVKLFNSGGATYTQLSAGNAAASLNYILPATSPSAGYVLSASAPSGSDVTLSWAAAASAASLTDTQVGFGDGTNMLSGSADFTYTTAAGQLSISKTVNGSMFIGVTNASNGAAAQARFAATADVSFAGVIAYSSGFTTSGLRTANSAVVDLDGPSAVILGQAAGTITLGLGTTARATLTDTQMAVLTAPTTGAGLSVAASTVTSGSLVSLSMTGTAAASNTKTGLAIASSGANGTASQTVYGQTINVTNTGTTNTNIGLFASASGGATANYSAHFSAGNVLVYDTTAVSGVSRQIFRSGAGQSTTDYLQFLANNGTTRVGGIYPGAGGNLYVECGVQYWAGGNTWGTSSSVSLNPFSPTLTGSSTFRLGWSSSVDATAAQDTIIRRNAAATVAFGATDAASPVAQTLSVQNVVAGTADTAGTNWTFIGSRGTGTGAGGNLIWQVAPAGGAGSSQNALINGLVLTSTGNLYGAALHNNSTSPTGTTNQYIASGTYTPTLTDVVNCTTNSVTVSQWIRVGNVVTVTAYFNIDPTSATTLTKVGISLPIASNFAGANQCCGTGSAPNVTGYVGAILGDTVNDRAELWFTTATDVTDQLWVMTFTYLIS